MPIPALLFVLSVIGFLISFYFVMLQYRWMSPQLPILPRICLVDQRSCDAILFTRDARILGIPNSLPGMAYYLAIITPILVPQFRTDISIRVLSILSIVTVVMGVYLTYSLLFKLNTRCVLCFTAHIINVTIMILLMAYVPQPA